MWEQVRERETGFINPKLFANRVKSNRNSSLQLSNFKEIVSAHRGAINSLQVYLIFTVGEFFVFFRN